MKKSVVIGAILLGAFAFAGQAAAITFPNCVPLGGGAAGTCPVIELNLWGASAQFQIYNQTAPAFLEGAPYSCANVSQVGGPPFTGSLGMSVGSGNAAQTAPCTDGNIYVIRASSKASYDGVLALQGSAFPTDKTIAAQNSNFCNPAIYPTSCQPGTGSDSCDYHYRLMYDTMAGGLGCKKVHLSLSDVNPSSFTQVQLATGRTFTSAGILCNGAACPNTFNAYNPMVVPFGFYVHTDVELAQCVGGLNDGQQCNFANGNADCGEGPYGSSGTCTQATLNNISKIQALMIFGKKVTAWSDFGKGYTSLAAGNSITACMRVAGSGTQATLDYGVFRANGALIGPAPFPGPPAANQIFSDGTGSELACIDTHAGAIGYADADYALSMNPLFTENNPATATVTYANTVPLKFEGVTPSRRAIRNGQYDNFYTKEWVFEDPSDSDYTTNHQLVTTCTPGPCPVSGVAPYLATGTGLMDELQSPATITATDRKDFWASLCEMNFMKSSDQVYPTKQTPSCPQTP